MINEIYTALTTALATALLVLGILFYSLSLNAENRVFKIVLRLMTFTYCFFGLVNILELWGRVDLSENDDILFFQAVTLVVAVSQAFLFAHTLILLIHAAYITRKRMVREVAFLFTFSTVFVVACLILPDVWKKVGVWMFILFYVYLLIKYTRIFVSTYRMCLQKMDNFFSGSEAEHLRWVSFSFFAALSIGVLALLASLFPNLLVGTLCSAIYFCFYLYFACRLINYDRFYRKIEEVLSDETILPELQNEDKTTTILISKPFETNLKIWLDKKYFLQPGVTIESVALQVGTNRSYFSEYINSVKGKTFRQWINELRIDEAKKLMIENPKMTLNELALQVGYSDKSHFIRQFSKLTGIFPKEYKRQENIV